MFNSKKDIKMEIVGKLLPSLHKSELTSGVLFPAIEWALKERQKLVHISNELRTHEPLTREDLILYFQAVGNYQLANDTLLDKSIDYYKSETELIKELRKAVE